jgi:hypothetical protein
MITTCGKARLPCALVLRNLNQSIAEHTQEVFGVPRLFLAKLSRFCLKNLSIGVAN